MLEEPRGWSGNITKDGKEYLWWKEHRARKGQWVFHKAEYQGKRTSISSISGGITKSSRERYSNKKTTLTKDFKAGLQGWPYGHQVPKWCPRLPFSDKTNYPVKWVSLVQGHGYYQNYQTSPPRPPTLPLTLQIRSMLLVILTWTLKKISHGILRTLRRVISPILNLLLYITLLIIVLTCTATQYPIKIASVLGISEKIPDPTNGRGTDGKMQMHKGGILLPTTQVLTS